MDKMPWYKKLLPYLPLVVRIIWYVILVTPLTVYVIRKWDIMVDFTFFASFNGNNALFIVWIIVLLLPLLTDFEGFGIKFGLWQQKQIDKEVPNEALNEVLTKISKQEYNNVPENIVVENNKIIERIEKKRGRK